MGSGKRFQAWLINGFGLMVTCERFPHAVSITLIVGCVGFYFGFGKGYDE